MSSLINAIDIMEDILKSITNDGAHFFTVYVGGFNYGHVTYSRNFGGGAFQGAFRYRYVEEDMRFILDAIHEPSRIIRKEFSLESPDSFDRIKQNIIEITNNMQTNRTIDKSRKGSILFRNESGVQFCKRIL